MWINLKHDGTLAFQPVTPVRGAYKDRKVSGRYRLLSTTVKAVCLVDVRVYTVRPTNNDTPEALESSGSPACGISHTAIL